MNVSDHKKITLKARKQATATTDDINFWEANYEQKFQVISQIRRTFQLRKESRKIMWTQQTNLPGIEWFLSRKELDWKSFFYVQFYIKEGWQIVLTKKWLYLTTSKYLEKTNIQSFRFLISSILIYPICRCLTKYQNDHLFFYFLKNFYLFIWESAHAQAEARSRGRSRLAVTGSQTGGLIPGSGDQMLH